MGVTAVVWILVAVPLLVALQLGLILTRNRIRRRIHPVVVAPQSPPGVTLEQIIGEELSAVFGPDFVSYGDDLDDPVLDHETARLSATVADRVAARAELDERARRTLARALPIAIRRELEASPTST